MATLFPFRALRPTPGEAARIAAVPYDVINADEARALARDNPNSFLRVSRPELELPPDTNPYGDEVYARAHANFARLSESVLVRDTAPTLYVYRLRMGAHEQTGLAGAFSVDDYESDVIKKHERTRRDKEDDRTRHMLTLRAQTGPVFLTYRRSSAIAALQAQAASAQPLFDFEAVDGVRHTIWSVDAATRDAIVSAFAAIETLYIADGHHRAASAARARADVRGTANDAEPPGPDGMLAVAFAHDEMQVLPYNRIVKDLAGHTADSLLAAIGESFTIADGPAAPARRGDIAMYYQHRWRTLRARVAPAPGDPIGSLDVSVLQDRLLAPVLKIGDVRTDRRIDFVGGARGTAELERHVDEGRAAVAFSLFPVDVADLMAVSDAGGIMPPKSTWFEPKLRDGLLIHMI